jgi:hypothetical protein
MRALLESRHDETYERGKADGIASVTNSALRRELFSFIMGAGIAAVAMWRILA